MRPLLLLILTTFSVTLVPAEAFARTKLELCLADALREKHIDVFEPWIDDMDHNVTMAMHSVAQKNVLSGNGMTLEGYDFSTSEGVVFFDSGFVPGYAVLPNSSRRLTWKEDSIKVERHLSRTEIDAVRSKARETVTESYEGLLQPEMVEKIVEAEGGLEEKHVSFGVVRDENGKIIGAVRVCQAYIKGGKVVLPGLEAMRALGILNEADEAQVNHVFGYNPADSRQTMPTVAAEEIGQFNIDRSLPSQERDAVRLRLLLWLQSRNLTFNGGDKMEVVTTSRKGQETLWGKFGISRLALEKTKGDVTEKVHYTTSAELKTTLDKKLGIK